MDCCSYPNTRRALFSWTCPSFVDLSFADEFVSVFDPRYREEVKPVRVGQKLANVGFRPDGRHACVSVTGGNKVAVIDLEGLEVVEEIPAGEGPWRLVVMSPPGA